MGEGVTNGGNNEQNSPNSNSMSQSISPNLNGSNVAGAQGSQNSDYLEMTIQEILLGKYSNTNSSSDNSNTDSSTTTPTIKTCGSGVCLFPGLIPLCRTYLEFIGIDSVTYSKLNDYMEFISLRAAGKIQTNAQFLREFVRSHSTYKKDSRVTQEAAYDLCLKAKRIGEGLEQCPEILGRFASGIPVCRPGANPFKRAEVVKKAREVVKWKNRKEVRMGGGGEKFKKEVADNIDLTIVDNNINANSTSTDTVTVEKLKFKGLSLVENLNQEQQQPSNPTLNSSKGRSSQGSTSGLSENLENLDCSEMQTMLCGGGLGGSGRVSSEVHLANASPLTCETRPLYAVEEEGGGSMKPTSIGSPGLVGATGTNSNSNCEYSVVLNTVSTVPPTGGPTENNYVTNTSDDGSPTVNNNTSCSANLLLAPGFSPLKSVASCGAFKKACYSHIGEFDCVQKQQLLNSYLINAKRKRDTAYSEAVAVKKGELEVVERQLKEIEKEAICSRESRDPTDLPRCITAKGLIEAHDLWMSSTTSQRG